MESDVGLLLSGQLERMQKETMVVSLEVITEIPLSNWQKSRKSLPLVSPPTFGSNISRMQVKMGHSLLHKNKIHCIINDRNI
jgi:hypothetical protein